MKGQSNGAMGTAQHKTAEPALEKVGKAAAIKKNQALLPTSEVCLECF